MDSTWGLSYIMDVKDSVVLGFRPQHPSLQVALAESIC